MFLKGSRYAGSVILTRSAATEGSDDGFTGIRARTIPATEGVIEHVVTDGDRLDLLARHYYNNDRLWWRIVDANPEFVFSGFMLDGDMKGKIILIPKARK